MLIISYGEDLQDVSFISKIIVLGKEKLVLT